MYFSNPCGLKVGQFLFPSAENFLSTSCACQPGNKKEKKRWAKIKHPACCKHAKCYLMCGSIWKCCSITDLWGRLKSLSDALKRGKKKKRKMLVDSAKLSRRKRSRRSETKLATEEQQSYSRLMPAGWLCVIMTPHRVYVVYFKSSL